jgi:hypothetical protein
MVKVATVRGLRPLNAEVRIHQQGVDRVTGRPSRLTRLSVPLDCATFGIVLFEGGIPAAFAPAARLLLFLGVLGAGITLIGMEYFFFVLTILTP